MAAMVRYVPAPADIPISEPHHVEVAPGAGTDVAPPGGDEDGLHGIVVGRDRAEEVDRAEFPRDATAFLVQQRPNALPAVVRVDHVIDAVADVPALGVR